MKECIKEYLIVLFIVLGVSYGWQGLELLFDGVIKPSMADTIVGVTLMISIHLNYRFIKGE